MKVKVLYQLPLFNILLRISNSADLQSGKIEKFHTLLNNPSSTMKELEESSWHGIPPSVRATTWRLLSVRQITHAQNLENKNMSSILYFRGTFLSILTNEDQHLNASARSIGILLNNITRRVSKRHIRTLFGRSTLIFRE